MPPRVDSHASIFSPNGPVCLGDVAAPEDWVTTPARKLSVAAMQNSMAPTSHYAPPEDCFVKYGETILRVSVPPLLAARCRLCSSREGEESTESCGTS